MNKFLTIKLICFLVLACFLINACKKQETPRGTYDLFPLKVGNEFYFKFDREEYYGLNYHFQGTEVWKVVDQSVLGNSIKYNIERKLNTIRILYNYYPGTSLYYTTTDSINSVRYMEISEDRTSSLITAEPFIFASKISFKRYQNNPKTEISQLGYDYNATWSCLFKADSGLTKYNDSTPVNYASSETLTLDSLKIIL